MFLFARAGEKGAMPFGRFFAKSFCFDGFFSVFFVGEDGGDDLQLFRSYNMHMYHIKRMQHAS
jgi:hypothetical protein